MEGGGYQNLKGIKTIWPKTMVGQNLGELVNLAIWLGKLWQLEA